MPALRLAVVGDPVSHSRSPELFRAMLADAGIEGSYDAVRVGAGEGSRRFAELRADGYTGLNVTTPLKEEAFASAETRDAAALAAGSVNLLVLGKQIAGYNTDGAGAIGALAAARLGNLEGKRILVLGAGPTARAAIYALNATGAHVEVWNRTRSRADAIVESLGANWFASGIDYDAILSTLLPDVTTGDVDQDVARALASAGTVIDANYGARSTLGKNFNRPNVIDGFEMLHASARASFAIFRNALSAAT